MSHFTKITTKIEDLEILAQVAKQMGFTLSKNAMCRYYFGTEMKDAVIKLPGSFDVGLVKEGNHYTITADLYDSEVERYIGVRGNTLLQKYAAEKTRQEAFQRGLSVTESEEDGKTILTLMDTETGGELKISCNKNGKIKVHASGFQGGACMKFKELEESLGIVDECELTADYYIVPQERNVETVGIVV